MEKLAIMLKLISIGCFVMAGKKYAESRYYQGKVDARTEMDASLQQMIRNLGRNIKEEIEEA